MGIRSFTYLAAAAGCAQLASAAPIDSPFNVIDAILRSLDWNHNRNSGGDDRAKVSVSSSSSQSISSSSSTKYSSSPSSSHSSTTIASVSASSSASVHATASSVANKVAASSTVSSQAAASSSVQIDGNCANTATTRQCWGGGYYIGTDSETQWPNTGVTKYYNLEITNITMAPDGTSRTVFAINGQYPGPTIEANWGDTVSVTVKNSLQYNGTSMHWHGVQQLNTNNMDGVNGVTECPLAPGDSKTYTWTASQYGTSWYHSHYSNQYGDGVLGPIVIHGPATANYDVDLGAYPITDWYYTSATDVGIAQQPVGIPWKADTGLINGTMVNSNGAGAYGRTTIQSGKTYLLRLINTSVDNHFKVHLDGHNMTIIQADFVAIEPQEVDWLFIAIGQRYDVLITASEAVDNYWFRAEPQQDCGENWNAGNIKSIFTYEGADATANPSSSSTSYTEGCVDQTGLIPWWKKDVPSNLFESNKQELDVLMTGGSNASWANGRTVVQWSIDDNLMTVDWEKPTVDAVFDGQTSNFTRSQNVIELPNANEWTFWVLQTLAGQITTAPHPIHLHGHDFFILGTGDGTFDPSSSTLNYNMPTRRDVAMLPALGWLVIAFQTDNPGAWLMHCHIAWHVGEGLALQFLERASEIPSTFSLGEDHERVCANWETYYNSAPYKMFESGL